MAIRLLITARDVAASLHLVEVARAARRDARFDIVVIAQHPAASRFEAAGLQPKVVSWPVVASANDAGAAELRRRARQLLDEIEPDVILAGLSTPFDASLDEAVLAEASVPTALYQDFWGEQNLILGRGADSILAIDEQAAERNAARFGAPGTVVGSARHSAYAAIDIPATRARVRAMLGVAAGERVVGFFGQALHAMPGYARTVLHFIECARRVPGIRLVLRPHPRENVSERRRTEEMFRDAGLQAVNLAEGPVEDALAACDVVVSLFSICTFDAAYLNRFSPTPVAVPMSMLFDEEIAAYCRQHGNYFDFAHHTLGLVKPVYDAAALPGAIDEALEPATLHAVWQRAHQHLPDPARAPQAVLDYLIAAARTRAGR